MAARLGLSPRDRDQLQPSEIRDLYDGLLWRRSREIEIVAAQTRIIVQSVLGGDATLEDFCLMFPGYVRDDGQ